MPTNSAPASSNGQARTTRNRTQRQPRQQPPTTSNQPPTTNKGPRVSDLFPTRWIHPHDLQGKTVNVFIEKVTIEKLWSAFDKEHVEKIVLWFHGKTKQLPLNVTQAQALVTITDTDFVMDWAGHACRLRAATARNGKPTIEILAPLLANQAAAAAPAVAAGAAGTADTAPDTSAQASGVADLPDDEPPTDEEIPVLEYIDEEDANTLFGE
ncbi:MAG: hypothetical protein H6641_16080 [Caldilineaceae bacterium]|nr:hypothetical protein [Caldilineaceae bacterium]